jgi:hypothetical protein
MSANLRICEYHWTLPGFWFIPVYLCDPFGRLSGKARASVKFTGLGGFLVQPVHLCDPLDCADFYANACASMKFTGLGAFLVQPVHLCDALDLADGLRKPLHL